MDALRISNDVKVCLKNDEVTHRFAYLEEWIQLLYNQKCADVLDGCDGPLQVETNEHSEKYFKKCYFGRFISLTFLSS